MGLTGQIGVCLRDIMFDMRICLGYLVIEQDIGHWDLFPPLYIVLGDTMGEGLLNSFIFLAR